MKLKEASANDDNSVSHCRRKITKKLVDDAHEAEGSQRQ
jgi:hypothetical protein